MEKLKKLAIIFLWITIAWNTFEGISAIILGLQAHSLALFAYGLESSIEIFASIVVLMELRGFFSRKLEEKHALQAIGVAYVFVSGYIAFQAISNFLAHKTADTSPLGVLLMIVTVFMMGGLGITKHILGKKLKSATVMADAKFTLIDGMLSFSVLIGLLIQFILPWWWLDHALALFLAAAALKEGVEELRIKN